MRKKHQMFIAIALFALLTLSACQHHDAETLLPELVRAELVMYQHPDSALMILEQMPMPAASNRLQHATWCLLTTQARYKNYIDESSDSLINIAYHYFMKQSDPQRKALALYLQGALNEEWHEAEQATQYYLDATKEVEKTDDYQLAYLIYAKLGTVYVYRALSQYAKDAYQKSLHYAELSGNHIYISSSLSFLARVYASLKDWNKAIRYYKEGIKIGEKVNNPEILGRALSELSAVYTRTGDYSSALSHIQKAIDVEKVNNIENEQNFLTKGNLYRIMGESDSAYFYLSKSLLTNNIYTKRSTYQALYNLSKKDKNYIQAFEYGENIMFYSDSIQKVNRSRAFIEMQEKYNQERVINERNQLKIEKDRVVRNSLLGLIALFFIIGTLVFIYQRKLIVKQRTIREHEERIRRYTLKIHDNDSLISRNENRINELLAEMEQNKDMQELLAEQQKAIAEIQNQNEVLCKENKDLQGNISHYSASLSEKVQELDALKSLSEENYYLRDREKLLCNQLLKQTKVLNDLKTKPKYLSIEHWNEVYEAVNRLYDNFTERLLRDIPSLTESDLQICCLVKLRLSVSDIAEILSISPTSVSKRKLRLKERIIQDSKKPLEANQTLDLWLWEY